MIKVFRRDANSGIFHRDMHLLAARRILKPDHAHQNMAFFGELYRIANEVGQNLPQPPWIADIAGGQEHVEIDHQIDALFPRARLQQHGDFVDRPLQIKGFGVKRHPLSLKL